MKTAQTMKLKQQLIAYLRNNDGWHASGALQRVEWPKWAYGEKRGLHTPRSVVRRLQELQREGMVNVESRKNHSWYSVGEAARPKKQVVTLLPNGNVVVEYV